MTTSKFPCINIYSNGSTGSITTDNTDLLSTQSLDTFTIVKNGSYNHE